MGGGPDAGQLDAAQAAPQYPGGVPSQRAATVARVLGMNLQAPVVYYSSLSIGILDISPSTRLVMTCSQNYSHMFGRSMTGRVLFAKLLFWTPPPAG